MADKKVFCNTPWFEIQIYWDGSLGICCQESHKLHTDSLRYNVATMTIDEWFNSEPVKNFRQRILGSSRISECSRCYHEEDQNGISRRFRSNQKSVIFTRTAFDESFKQSPHNVYFDSSGLAHTQPVDIHIDLGNYCNLACKMCHPQASSTIAQKLVRMGDTSAQQYIGTDWTKNQNTWNSVLEQLAEIPNLNNVHFMGGETLLTPRFHDFVDFMTQKRKFSLNFSFVTNGTVFDEALLEKLKRFGRVGIEVSIETTTAHNDYVRQGTDTQQVLKNINRYLQHCNNTNITVTARPAISALTIGRYHTVLEYCAKNSLLVKSLLVTTPSFLAVQVLPKQIRQNYIPAYEKLYNDLELDKVDSEQDFNDSNPYRNLLAIKKQIQQCVALLTSESSSADQFKDLVNHCARWDRLYGYDALTLYPELKNLFVEHGYSTVPH